MSINSILNIDSVCDVLTAKGYKFFTNGDFNVNIVGVRSNTNVANSFDDNLILILGGQSKGSIDFTQLIPCMENRVNSIVAYGVAGIEIKNQLDEGYLRPIVFLGSESLGIRATELSVNVAVAAWEWPSYMSPEAKKNGISIIKSSYEQYSNPLHSGYKIIGTYINSTMALHEALAKGADEALLLDKNGYISEGSGENIFIVKDNKISTPKIDHCLNGITRQSVIKIAEDFGFEVTEKDITYEELVSSDEVFFTGTAVEITPISKVDGILIGSGSIGPITEKLQTTYGDIVSGRNSLYKNWLSVVSD